MSQPDRSAIIMAGSGRRVTYAELERRSNQLANVLRARGLTRGDHLALVLENRPELFEVGWAALRSGLYVTPISTHFTKDEASFIIDDCGAKALITSAELEATLGFSTAPLPSLQTRLMVDGEVPGYESYDGALGSVSSDPLFDPQPGSLMNYTSGTTGRPRGVKHALPGKDTEDLYAQVIAARYGFGPESVYLSTGPLYHGAPFNYATSVHRLGGTVVVMERFEARRALELIEQYRVTQSFWVPSMFVRMLRLPAAERAGFDLSSHQAAIHAAAPCPADIKQEMIEWWGPILYEFYGGTEGVGSTAITSEEWLEHRGSVGRSQRGKIVILDPSGSVLDPGQVGNIYFVTDNSFAYHNDPTKTAEAYRPGGLATFGDIGYLDAEGYLYLTDRKDYTIISGGVNIYPREIEDVLISHPSVVDVAVFGVPDADFGERVMAVVQLVPGHPRDDAFAAELVAFAGERLSRFKLPRTMEFVDELPRLPNGKLSKRQLREQYWHGHSTQIV